MRVLVTGGAGYIGAHACVLLLEAGHEVVVIDNLCNSGTGSLRRVQELAGRPLRFVQGDVRDAEALEDAFAPGIDAVLHFAGLKSVAESCAVPDAYYDNNVGGSVALLQAMRRHGVNKLVFSSSAAIYGDADEVPVRESAPARPTSPYGRSKAMVEQIIADHCHAEPAFAAVLLRYFNPVGAHPSGRLGEDPEGSAGNLMPVIAAVASGRRARLDVFGGDYPTPDGTGVRDYLHVMDLAAAHVSAVDYLAAHAGASVFNLGTGRGCSVLELVRAFQGVSGRNIAYDISGRRSGDIACLYADPALAAQELGWTAERTLAEMCADTWRWQQANPCGYKETA